MPKITRHIDGCAVHIHARPRQDRGGRIELSWRTPDGQRHRRLTLYTDPAAALDLARELPLDPGTASPGSAGVLAGTPAIAGVPPAQPPPAASNSAPVRIRDLADWYETHLLRLGRAERTIAKYRQIVTDFDRWARGNGLTYVHQIRHEHVDAFSDWLSAAHPRAQKGKPRRDTITILRAWLNAAHDAGKIQNRPITKWFAPRARTRETIALTAHELRAVLDAVAAHDTDIANITSFIAATGCRPSDAIDLRWSQVDLDNRLVRRRQVKTDHLATYALAGPALAAIHAEQARDMPGPQGQVFTSAEARPWTTNKLYHRFTRALDRAGLRIQRDGQSYRPNLKTLRHTYASRMAELGCPAFLLQRQLGHTRIETTLNYYHADPAESLRWAEIFSKKILKTP